MIHNLGICVILSKAHEILKLCFQFVLAKVEMWKAYYIKVNGKFDLKCPRKNFLSPFPLHFVPCYFLELMFFTVVILVQWELSPPLLQQAQQPPQATLQPHLHLQQVSVKNYILFLVLL